MRKKSDSHKGRWAAVAVALFFAALIVAPNPISRTKASGVRGSRQLARLGAQVHRIGEVPALVNQSAYQGPMEPSETITMHLSFQPSDESGIVETVNDLYDRTSPNFHHWLTPKEFGQRFGRSPEEVQQAGAWLISHGLTINQVWPNMLTISFSGTVDAVQRAFGVTISQYQDAANSRTFYSNDREPALPSDFSFITAGLAGLNNAYVHHPGKIKASGPVDMAALKARAKASHRFGSRHFGSSPDERDNSGDFFMGPADFAAAYDVTPVANAGTLGQGQRVGIIGDSDVADKDIDLYRTFYGLPPANVQRIPVPNATGKVFKDKDGQFEASLDYSSVSAMAPDAEIDLILVPSGELTFANTFAAEEYEVNTLMIPAVDESFGACESLAYTQTEQALFQQAAAEGLAFFASSGDDASECAPAGTSIESNSEEVGCPACYDGLTAVGGTSYSGGITDTNGTLLGIQDETVWNDAPGAEFTCNSKSTGGGGTGGGISTFVAMPAYQSNAMGFTGGVPAASGRIVPDVSMLSLDPPTVVFLKGNGFFIGGTSMSAPLWAGMMALINQSTGAPQGSPNTELYRLATIQFKNNGPLMFTDITEGDNSVQPLQPCLPSGLAGFAAAVGFDAASGWGPPDLSVLAKNYGQQTIEPITIPSAPPVISNFSAELNGDALTLILLGTSGAGAITETQATLLDGNQAVVSTGGSVPISLRHSTTVGFSVEIDGLSQLPTAENVTLVLKDKFGQLSAPMSFNFSVAAPGGPGLSGATLNGKKFIIQGSGLSGKLFLEVNGLLVKSKVGAGDTVTFKGTTAGLNLQPGPNRIRVLSASGLFSNIFIFQM